MISLVVVGSLILLMTMSLNGCQIKMTLLMTPFARWLLLMLYFKAVTLEEASMNGVTATLIPWEAMVAGLPNGCAVRIPYPTIHSVMVLLCV